MTHIGRVDHLWPLFSIITGFTVGHQSFLPIRRRATIDISTSTTAATPTCRTPWVATTFGPLNPLRVTIIPSSPLFHTRFSICHESQLINLITFSVTPSTINSLGFSDANTGWDCPRSSGGPTRAGDGRRYSGDSLFWQAQWSLLVFLEVI